MESQRDKASCQSPNWSSLPQELKTAILVRLPVKYLLQFKSVSKYSLRLISSPQFVKTHLSFSAKDYRFLLCNSGERKVKHCSVTSLFDDRFTNPFYLDLPVEKLDDNFHIVGSVNGLICFLNGVRKGFILWNPSTRKFKKVPAPTEPCGLLYGFGYDDVYDDYKLVGVSIDCMARSAIMYSLRSDSWRELDFQGTLSCIQSAKLVNGKLHWATGSSASDDWGIISFDLVDEKFGELVQPSYKEGIKYLSLGVLGSDLSTLCNYVNSNYVIYQSDVWVMKKYGVVESWMKLYTINYPGTYPDTWMQHVTSSPLCMSSKGENLFVNVTALRIYNPEDKSFITVVKVKGYLQAELYIESLVCPYLQERTNDTTLKAAKRSSECSCIATTCCCSESCKEAKLTS